MIEQHTGIFTKDMNDYLGSAPGLELEELGDGLWTVSAGDYRTIFLADGREAVAVNTFGTPAIARAYGGCRTNSPTPSAPRESMSHASELPRLRP